MSTVADLVGGGGEGAGGRGRGQANRLEPLSGRQLLTVAGISALAVLALWDTALLLPLQLTVTFIHESMHALVAMLLGADVHSITINSKGGGLMRSSHRGSDFEAVLVGSAGYVGAALVGGVMFELCARVRTGRVVIGVLGLLIAAAGLAWVPLRTSPDGLTAAVTGSTSGDGRFTIVFCVLAVLVAASMVAAPFTWLRRVFLLVLATGLCLGAVEDLRNVLASARRGGVSDAWALEQITGLPSWLWAGLWLLVGVAACGLGVWSALSRERPGQTVPLDRTPTG